MNGRWVENGLAILGGLIAAAYVVLVEIVPHSGLVTCQMPTGHGGVPWGVVILVVAMVLPKTIGRATAGAVWQQLGARLSRVSGAIRRGKP